MKQKIKTQYIVAGGVMAAMITVMTAYIFHIPVGTGYLHFGDAMIYLSACILPTPYAMLAGALGGAFADLLTAPVWTPATLIIKALLVLPFTAKSEKILTKRNVFAVVTAGIITFAGYYLAEALLMLFGLLEAGGMSVKEIFLAPAVTLPTAWIQPVGSAALFLVLGLALDKLNFKKRVLG